MFKSKNKNVNNELFMDALSDCSEDSEMQISDNEFNDDSIIVPVSPSNHRILKSTLDDDVISVYNTDEDNIVHDVDDCWSENDIKIKLEEYDRTSGMNTIPQDKENVWEIVQLFLGNDLFELLVTETNRYHSQVANKSKEYKTTKWVDVTVNEMKKFLGLIILMGQLRKDEIYDYWSTLPYIETPIFSKTMSRNRFMQIWGMWHFCNNDLLHDKSDKLFKIRQVLNYLQHKFQTVYIPKQELSLNDGLIPWRGRLSFRTYYNPTKLVKYGILVRILSEATSGYIFNFNVCSGAEGTLQDTILKVLDPCVGFHHHIYMDNYCNSIQVAELLLKKHIRVCGTIKVNRGLPQNLKNITLLENETKFARKGELLLQLWQAKKDQTIRIFSTIHSAEMVKTPHRSGVKTKPKSFVEYNKYKKGVDCADQYMSYYNILRKSTKWTKKAVLYFLNAALFNSFIIQRKLNNKKTTYKKFLLKVATALIETCDTQCLQNEEQHFKNEEPSKTIKKTKRAPRHDPPGRLSQDFKKHKLIPIVTGGQKSYPHRRCRVCFANKKTGYTRYVCEYCNVPLHKMVCFERYHTVKKY